jgi:hypothetical protein
MSGKSYIKIEGEFYDDGFYTVTDCTKHFAEIKAEHEAFVIVDDHFVFVSSKRALYLYGTLVN